MYLFFLFLLQNIDCGYLEAKHVPTSKNFKKYQIFSAKTFALLELKNLSILHGYVFVMRSITISVQLNAKILGMESEVV